MDLTTNNLDYRVWLKSKICERQVRNPSYSLRSFARSIDVSQSLLSLILNGKRPLTQKTAEKIADALNLNPRETGQLLAAILSPEPARVTEVLDRKINQIKMDQFDLISEWQHYAILSLSKVKGAKADPKWISSRLGISMKKVSLALECLKRLELIEIHPDLSFEQILPNLDTSYDVPSTAIRRHHVENLQNAERSLERDSIDERYFGAQTFAIKQSRLEEAKDVLRQFRQDFDAQFEESDADRVYTLALQLFPIDQGE